MWGGLFQQQYAAEVTAAADIFEGTCVGVGGCLKIRGGWQLGHLGG